MTWGSSRLPVLMQGLKALAEWRVRGKRREKSQGLGWGKSARALASVAITEREGITGFACPPTPTCVRKVIGTICLYSLRHLPLRNGCRSCVIPEVKQLTKDEIISGRELALSIGQWYARQS